jgi:NADPH:quinone reductase-like Zn-dependent oxidoreductase
MQALYFESHGGPEVLRYGEVPDPPPPAADEVTVEIRAAALNHLDLFVREGWAGLELKMPHVGGADGAGVVTAVGEAVSDWRLGDRVVIDPGVSTRSDEWTRRGQDSMSPGYQILGEQRPGTLAERLTVPAANLCRIPDDVSFTEAAAPLLVGLTAWNMLITRARLRPGESVLIVGAGGGLNSFAIQVAKLAGATVYALTSSEAKMERARALGADHVLDYRDEPRWSKPIFKLTGRRGIDVVVDNVGRATIPESIRALTRGGRLVTVGNTSGPVVEIDIRYLFAKQVSWIGATMGSHQEFRTVLAQIWRGRLRPVIDRVLPLADGAEAYRVLERGEQFGKIVLEPSHG